MSIKSFQGKLGFQIWFGQFVPSPNCPPSLFEKSLCPEMGLIGNKCLHFSSQHPCHLDCQDACA